MVSGIFSVIQLILKLIGLWEQFQDYSDKERLKASQERTQEREKAVDKQQGAQSEDEFDRAQDDIVKHKPK